MRRAIESFAVMMVFILIGLIVGLTVRYNMIDFDARDEVPDVAVLTSARQSDYVKKSTTEDYLQSLEAYGDDKDVKVDPSQEKVDDTANTQRIIPEESRNDDIVNALNDIVAGADSAGQAGATQEQDPAVEIEAIVEGAR